MADNKKYYYMRLKEDFFNSDEMIVLESLKDGFVYSNILLKLYLRSLKTDGALLFRDKIPYSPEVLATVVRHPVGMVKEALRVFSELGLIEIIDNGTIFMTDIQNFIGKSSTEAERKKDFRRRIETTKAVSLPDYTGQKSGQMSRQISDKCLIDIRTNVQTNVGQFSDKYIPEIEIDLDLKKEIKRDVDLDQNSIKIQEGKKQKNVVTVIAGGTSPPTRAHFSPPSLDQVAEYCKERENGIDPQRFLDHYEARGWMLGKNKMKDWKAAVRTWETNGLDKGGRPDGNAADRRGSKQVSRNTEAHEPRYGTHI